MQGPQFVQRSNGLMTSDYLYIYAFVPVEETHGQSIPLIYYH